MRTTWRSWQLPWNALQCLLLERKKPCQTIETAYVDAIPNDVLLAFLSLRSKEWCFNMRSRFRFCPVWLPVFSPLCLGFYSGAWPEERGHHHGWYREGWWVFPVHARLPQGVSKACSRKVVVLIDLCFSNSWLGDFETDCSDFATLLAVCLWVANT